MKIIDNIDDHSEGVRDILEKQSPTVYRVGSTVVLTIILILFLLASQISYPDVLSGEIIILDNKPPVEVFSKKDGRIEKIFMQDGDLVEKGEILCVMEDAADISDVLHLEKSLIEASPLQRLNALGSLQESYSQLLHSIRRYEDYIINDNTDILIDNLNDQISLSKDYFSRLLEEQKITKRQIDLGEKEFERNKILNKEGVISDQDLEKAEIEFLQLIIRNENLNKEILNQEIKINDLKNEISTLRYSSIKQLNELKTRIDEIKETLKGAIMIWKQQNIVASPIKGEVSLSRILADNQFVRNSELLFTIVRNKRGSNSLRGMTTLPIDGAGKIEKGMKVSIHLKEYPSKEFGILYGFVESLSSTPSTDNYLVTVSIPSLLTSYGKEINYKPGLKGEARIITEKSSLLQRIFSKIRSINNE